MSCIICRNPRQVEMINDYARTLSFRETAKRFNVNYRSLQRHLESCLYTIMQEAEQRDFDFIYALAVKSVTAHFHYQMRPRRKKSIITKKVKFTWSRKGWKAKSGHAERGRKRA